MSKTEPAKSASSSGGQGKILVVDDDFLIRETVSAILKAADYQIIQAEDGAAAMNLASKTAPDLVLLDIVLPDVDGYEICARIRECSPDLFLPVILLTSRGDLESKVSGFSAGADDYITKPVSPEELLARVRVMLRLRHSQASLMRLEKARNDFLAVVTHDLKLPISLIQSFCDFLLAKKRPLETEDRDMLNRINSNAQFMQRMVSYFLDRNTLASGQLVLRPTRVRVDRLLEDCVERTEPLSEHREIELVVEPPARELPPLYIDRDLIVQVVDNLLSNAVKFSRKGRPVRAGTLLLEDSVEVFIDDAGPGIPEDKREYIFQEGSRIDQTRQGEPPTPGTGLGLYICRNIVGLHGGRIWVEDGEQSGARFKFSLPLRYERDRDH